MIGWKDSRIVFCVAHHDSECQRPTDYWPLVFPPPQVSARTRLDGGRV